MKTNEGLVAVLTNDPVGDFRASGRRIENAMVALIDDARSSVNMAVYNFDSQIILDALVAAKTRGVQIKVVGDYHELSTDSYKAMVDAGLNLVAGNLNAIQHNKFLVIDEKILVTGTGNFSHSDFYHNDNNFLIFRDEAVAAIYQKEFQQMHTGFFSTLKSSSRLSPGQSKTKLPIEIFFSPQESRIGVQYMIDKIDAATDSIHYMIFAFSHDEIATALLKAARRGVRVYGIHDTLFLKGTSQEAPRLYRGGFKAPGQAYATGPHVRADGNTNTFLIRGAEHGGKMHCKTMIIDPETDHGLVLTGSFNWSNNAVENNDENMVSIADPGVAQTLKRQFDQAWKIARDPVEILPASGFGAGSPANLHDIYISEIHWAGTSSVSPGGAVYDPDDDFIEIHNRTMHPVDITGWTLAWTKDDIPGLAKEFASYTFSVSGKAPLFGAILQPGEYRILYGNNSGVISQAASFYQNGIKIPDAKRLVLPDAEIELGLYDQNMNLVDKVLPLPGLREGYFDPLLKTSASANRRLKPGAQGAPEDARSTSGYASWYTSTVECPEKVCLSPYLLASPGYANEAAGPVVFKTIKTNGDDSFTVTFSGPVDQCVDPTGFMAFDAGGPIAIEGLTKVATKPDQLVFRIAGASDPAKTYGLKSKAFGTFMGRQIRYVAPDFFLGTAWGLSRSGDGGITFQEISLEGPETKPVRKIRLDPATGILYVATSSGLYKTPDNGATFQKIAIGANLLSNMVYDVGINTGFLAVATGDGLYLADKSLLNFQKIHTSVFFSLYLDDALLLAGGANSLYRFDAPFTNPPLSIYPGGKTNDIVKIGASYYAASTSGLYISTDAQIFTPVFPEVFSEKIVQSIDHDLGQNLLAISLDQVTGINPLDILLSGLFIGGQRANLRSTIFNGTTPFSLAWAVADFGPFSGNSLDTLVATHPFSCGPGQSLPAGSIFFDGYGSTEDKEPADIVLNELSLVNPDGRDFVELYVTKGGTLKDTALEYYDGFDKEVLWRFANRHVNTGEVIVVYLASALDQKNTLGNDARFAKSTPYIVYAPHENLNRGDGLLIVTRDNAVKDALYYTNKDASIFSGFMLGGLQKAYFSHEIQNLLPRPLPFAINGFNDTVVQDSGVNIANSGNSRALLRTSFIPNTWAAQKNPTPGIK